MGKLNLLYKMNSETKTRFFSKTAERIELKLDPNFLQDHFWVQPKFHCPLRSTSRSKMLKEVLNSFLLLAQERLNRLGWNFAQILFRAPILYCQILIDLRGHPQGLIKYLILLSRSLTETLAEANCDKTPGPARPAAPGQPVSLKKKETKGRTKIEFYARFLKRFFFKCYHIIVQGEACLLY